MTRAPRAPRAGRLPGVAGRSARVAALAVLAAAPLAACGIPADDEPRAISESQAPEVADRTVTDDAGAAGSEPATLYFTRVLDDRNELVALEVRVPVGSSGSPSPATVIETLLGGVPGDDEHAANLGSHIPPDTALASQPELATGGVLMIDLNDRIYEVVDIGARLAYGQIVCTAAELPGVDAVRVNVDGEPRPAPRGDGSQTRDALTCGDYADLVAPPS